MSTVTFTIGISASGKTTWVERNFSDSNFTEIICRDDIRCEIMEEKGLEFTWKSWNWKLEKNVTARQRAEAALLIAKGKNFVVADTNLNLQRLCDFADWVESLGATVRFKFFDVTFEEACRRDSERSDGVGYSVIAKQVEQLEQMRWDLFHAQTEHELAILKEVGDSMRSKWNLPCLHHRKIAIMVDIDGTVAHMNGRGPYDWDKVDDDKPDWDILGIVDVMSRTHEVIFLSGRDGCCYAETKIWLEKVLDPRLKFELLMRAAGDNRPDSEVKLELFKENVYDRFNVLLVIDDRPRVCRVWREIGLKVLQVGNPYVEF